MNQVSSKFAMPVSGVKTNLPMASSKRQKNGLGEDIEESKGVTGSENYSSELNIYFYLSWCFWVRLGMSGLQDDTCEMIVKLCVSKIEA